ncbi:hypothetical protein [Nonomuraea sp. NPDC002799]
MRVHFEFDGADAPQAPQAGQAPAYEGQALNAGAALPSGAPGQTGPDAGPYDAGAAPADLVARLGAHPGAGNGPMRGIAGETGDVTVDGGAAPQG